MTQIKSLTGLRFIAAFYVFIFHINMGSRAPLTFLPVNVQSIIHQGYLGVTLFFVLSGFVLTYSYLKQYPDPTIIKFRNYLQFLYKRFARLYPIYLFGLLLCLGIEIFFGRVPAFILIISSATLLQSYFPALAMQWYDGGGWSVINEFFFYLMLPIALPILTWVPRNALPFLLIVVIGFGSFLGLVYDGLIPSPFRFPYSWAYWFPPLRFNEFAAGIITGLLVFKFNWKVPFGITLLFSILCLWYLAHFGPLLPITVTHNWLVVPTIILVIISLSQAGSNFLKRILELPIFQYLGKSSYSFYIFQMPLFTIFGIIKGSYEFSIPNWQIALILLALNLTASILMYNFIEKKAQKLLLSLMK